MTDAHREKIANSNVLTALINHVEGRLEMQASQVTAALGLLRKVLPDLAASDSTVTLNASPKTMSDHELSIIASSGGAGADDAPDDPAQLN